MGMFDWINVTLLCPKCGRTIHGFQSKDGNCMLECLEFWKVDNFYSYCDHCEAMIDYTLKEDVKEKIRKSIDDIRKALTINEYELEFRDSTVLANNIRKHLEEIDKKEKEKTEDINHKKEENKKEDKKEKDDEL